MFKRFERLCAGREGHRHFGGGRGGFAGGPLGGGFRGRGGGKRTAKMLTSGDLQLIMLLLLSEKSRHGYEIIKAVEDHSSGVYTPSPGMVYPALTYLEEMGYAVAAADGAKRLFSVTEEGGAYLRQHQATAQEVWNQLAIFGRKLAHFQKQFAEDEDVAEHFGSGSNAEAKSDWHAMRAEFRALRDEMKAAIYEKLNSSMEDKRRVLDILRRTIGDIRGL